MKRHTRGIGRSTDAPWESCPFAISWVALLAANALAPFPRASSPKSESQLPLQRQRQARRDVPAQRAALRMVCKRHRHAARPGHCHRRGPLAAVGEQAAMAPSGQPKNWVALPLASFSPATAAGEGGAGCFGRFQAGKEPLRASCSQRLLAPAGAWLCRRFSCDNGASRSRPRDGRQPGFHRLHGHLMLTTFPHSPDDSAPGVQHVCEADWRDFGPAVRRMAHCCQR